ncbi:MAG: sulfite exporter TauE/SafE family protein [Phycisphaerales bacterium JB059]
MEIGLSLVFGALVGLSLGALGAGGSILVLPALLYGLGLAERQSVVLALVIVGATSLYGSVIHARQGNVRAGAAAVFSVTGFGGAWVGAMLSHRVPGVVLILSLALVMLVVSVRMYLSAGRKGAEPVSAEGASWIRRSAPLLVAGVGVGFLTGFLGVGGGFLIVPALTLVGRMEVKQAIGTSLVIIAVNCVSGLIAHRFAGLDWMVILPFVAGSFTASTFAARLVRGVSAATLKRAFAVFILLLGLLMLGDAAWRMGDPGRDGAGGEDGAGRVSSVRVGAEERAVSRGAGCASAGRLLS